MQPITIIIIIIAIVHKTISQTIINEHCTPQEVYSVLGLPPQPLPITNSPKCYFANSNVNDYEGILQCDYLSCCLCTRISCGINNNKKPCQLFKVSDKGAIGVQTIVIYGGSFSNNNNLNLPGYIPPPGAIIECAGVDACRKTTIWGVGVKRLSCDSTSSCQESNIYLYDPAPNFGLYCNGHASCQASNIIINIGESPPPGMMCNPSLISKEIIIGAIVFHGESSAKSTNITINNNGCDQVIISTIRCTQTSSCPDTNFIFNGNVELKNCQTFNRLTLLPSSLQSCYTEIPKLSCVYSNECSNIVRSIKTPLSGFIFECLSTNSCQNLRLTLDYQPSNNIGYVSDITEFKFAQPNAASGAIIRIVNNQLIGAQRYAPPIILNAIVCTTAYSCNGLTIIAGDNVDILSTFIDCTMEPNACFGCKIKDESTNTEYPCDYKTQISSTNPPMIIPGSPQLPQLQQPILPQFVPRAPSPTIPQFIPAPNRNSNHQRV